MESFQEVMINEETGEKMTLKKNPGHIEDRSEVFHQILLQDFRFMEAARLQSREYEGAKVNSNEVDTKSKLSEQILTNPYAIVNFANYNYKFFKSKRRRKKGERRRRIPLADVRTRRFETKMARMPPFNIWAHWILYSTFFSILTIIVVIINSVLLAVDSELGDSDDNEYLEVRKVLECVDYVFLLLFVVEIILKWVDNFFGFWFELWNIFDFIVTGCSLIGPILNIILPDNDNQDQNTSINELIEMVKYIRILRIFRSLNVISRWQKISIILKSIVRSLRALVFISLLTLIFFYIFAIIGMNIFESDPETALSKREDLKYRRAFKSLQSSLITLFHVFTDDHWYELIEDLAQVKGWVISSIYVIIWIILGSFIFKNIFAGVMVSTFQNIREEQQRRERDLQPVDKEELGHKLSAFVLGENLEEENMKNRGDKPTTLDTWEEVVMNTIDLITLNGDPAPAPWPRDTLFHFFVLMETLVSNLEERDKVAIELNRAYMNNLDD